MSIEDDIIVKQTAKPEGPAREPQISEEWSRSVEGVVRELASLHKAAIDNGCGLNLLPIPTAIYWLRRLNQPVPATPAPSQPAGAREDELLREFAILEITELTDSERYDRQVAALRAYARQQTAAKDAELADAKSTAINYMNEASRACDEIECLKARAEAAERERDSLREVANKMQEAWASRQINYEHEVVTLDFGAAQLIEDTLAALKAGKGGKL